MDLAWMIINIVTLIGIVLIGKHRWEGWLLFLVANLGWLAYSFASNDPWWVQVFNVLFIAVSGYFMVAWRRTRAISGRTV